jgi:hypothetical protein
MPHASVDSAFAATNLASALVHTSLRTLCLMPYASVDSAFAATSLACGHTYASTRTLCLMPYALCLMPYASCGHTCASTRTNIQECMRTQIYSVCSVARYAQPSQPRHAACGMRHAACGIRSRADIALLCWALRSAAAARLTQRAIREPRIRSHALCLMPYAVCSSADSGAIREPRTLRMRRFRHKA